MHARAHPVVVHVASAIAFAGPAGAADVEFTPHVLTTSTDGAFYVCAADLDGDDDIDVITGSVADEKIAWFENTGGTPPLFTEHVISTSYANPIALYTADMDGDADIDILAALETEGRLRWFENDGGSPPSFAHRVVSSIDQPHAVCAADIDGDSDLDVLGASMGPSGRVAWFESDGLSPPSFIEQTLATNLTYRGVCAADLDGDLDLDVFAIGWVASGVFTYENDGGSEPAFVEHYSEGLSQNLITVSAADIDDDGDIDFLTAGLENENEPLAWYRNEGGSPPVFTWMNIQTSTIRARMAHAADVDNDGDLDVVMASDDEPGFVEDDFVAWYENDGGATPAFTEHIVTFAVDGVRSVFAADLDGDGDTDLLSASHLDDTIAWYENTGVVECPGDADGDGDVDVNDIAFVIFRLGPCPQ